MERLLLFLGLGALALLFSRQASARGHDTQIDIFPTGGRYPANVDIYAPGFNAYDPATWDIDDAEMLIAPEPVGVDESGFDYLYGDVLPEGYDYMGTENFSAGTPLPYISPEVIPNANLWATLATIRVAEGTPDADGYRRIYGGALFDDFSDHPRKMQTFTFRNGKTVTSDAAGAYQFLSTTWDEAARALGLPDFSPESQDIAAIWLIRRRGALNDILAGRLESALNKLSYEWASLPPGRYGQPVKTADEVAQLFIENGGSLA